MKKFLRKLTATLLCGLIMFSSLSPPVYAASDTLIDTSEIISTQADERIGTDTVSIPTNYRTVYEVNGNGTALSTGSYTLKAGNTYYVELAGGSGGDDSWYIYQGDAQTRFYTEGGHGGYQILVIIPTQNTTLTFYAGGEGAWNGAGQPDGQSVRGGGSSSVWLGTPGEGGTLLAAAGGGGGAVGGTSDLPGYDGGDGYGTSSDHTTIYHDFTNGYNEMNGREWFSWEENADTDEWRDIIVADVNYFDKGGYFDGKDRIPGWDSTMTADQFFDNFILYGDNVEGGGGGGGFPAGTCTHYHWAGWYVSNGWHWVSNNMIYNISTGGYGYTMDPSIAATYGLQISSDAIDGQNDGNGYAKVWAEAFTLTVDPNGGSYQGSIGITKHNMQYLDTLYVEDPVRPGYTFLGWSRTGGGIFDDATNMYTFQKTDETFTAQWQEDRYTITYNLQGGTVSQANPTSYTYNTPTFTLNNPTRTGYLFLGWTGTDLGTTTSSVTIPQGSTGNRTYTAQWQKLADLPLIATTNLGYKATVKTAGGSGTQVALNQGGADLNWSGFSVSGPLFNVYYKQLGAAAYSQVNSLLPTTTRTAAFNTGSTAANFVYDKAAPNAPEDFKLGISGDNVNITWEASTDNGSSYQFRVDAIDEYSTLQPWQKILNTAGYTADQAKQCASFNAMVSNTTYLAKIMTNQTAMNMLKQYYGRELNSAIDTYYSETLNTLNYQLGLKAYLIRNGVPTSLLPASGWSYGYTWGHSIGGSGVSDTGDWRYDPYWMTDHDSGRLTTGNGVFYFADGDYQHAVYKSTTAINTARYAGGALVVTGSNSGSAATIRLTNSSGRYYNTLSTVSYTSGYSNNGTTYLTGIPNYGSLAGYWNRTEATRSSWANAQWGISSAGGYPVLATSDAGEWPATASATFSTSARISLNSSNSNTAQYLMVSTNGGETRVSNMYLEPGAVSSSPDSGAPAQTIQYISNEAQVNITTGIRGYLYVIDGQENTTVNWSNGSWSDSNSISVARKTTVQYLHVAAVDKAGNVSATKTVAISGKDAPTTVQYTIQYNGNGATGGSTPSSTHYQDVAQALTANGFTKTGYHFVGWDTSEDGATVVYTDGQSVTNLSDVNGDVIDLYAVWEPNRYTIKYEPNGGTGTIPDQPMVYDTPGIIDDGDDFSRPGYVLVGWSRTPNGMVEFLPDSSITNLTDKDGDVITLYAIWQRVSYTIHFDGNGATSGSMDDVTIYFNESTKLPKNEFERQHYRFLGWSLTPDGEVAFADEQEVLNLVDENTPGITLYAVWEDIRVYISGETTNSRTQVKNVYKQGEQGRLDINTQGYAMKVTVTFPDDWAELSEDYNHVFEIEVPAFTDSIEWYFFVPLLAEPGEYQIVLDAENEFGYTARAIVTIIVTSDTILDEIRTRILND